MCVCVSVSQDDKSLVLARTESREKEKKTKMYLYLYIINECKHSAFLALTPDHRQQQIKNRSQHTVQTPAEWMSPITHIDAQWIQRRGVLPRVPFRFLTLLQPSGRTGCFRILMILTTLRSRKRSWSNQDAFPHQKPITDTKGVRGAGGGLCSRDWLPPSELWQVRWRDSTPMPPASELRSFVWKVTVAA